MGDLRTNQNLLAALEKATSTQPTRDQIEKQRLSFVMGALPTDRNITRDQVQQILNHQKGVTAAAE